jgi:3-hydroxyisobutyrate dehydrogenase-like beta-hydroxyacid dehydrogenase
MNVAFIGLGRMGHAMASRLVGEFDLAVFNRTPERAAGFAQSGARVAASVADACDGRDVVITMLADDAALTELTLEPGGIRDSLKLGGIHLAMGTHGVSAVQELAAAHREHEQTLVAAPVLGRPDVAASGTLGIVAAGPADAVQRCEPLFALIGSRTFNAGTEPASASAVKLANNFVLGCAIEAMSEAFALVGKYGVPARRFYDVIVDGLFSAPAYRVYGDIIADEKYDQVGFTAELGLKDVNLMLAAGTVARVPLPSGNVYRDRLLGAIAHGEGELDWAVMAREAQRASGAA